PLGIALTRRPAWRAPVLALANVFQTIPSLALFGFLIPVFGIGAWAAITALIVYALLPIIRNTYTGIAGVDPAVREAGRGMGMTDGELLRLGELPLAAGVIRAGMRVAVRRRGGRAELHRVRPAGRDRRAAGGAPAPRAGAAAAAPRWHVRVSSSDHRRTDRPVRRVHRHRVHGGAQARTGSRPRQRVPPGGERIRAAVRPALAGAVRLQQHLRDPGARHRRRALRAEGDLRPEQG